MPGKIIEKIGKALVSGFQFHPRTNPIAGRFASFSDLVEQIRIFSV
jgi:hypothetical protein